MLNEQNEPPKIIRPKNKNKDVNQRQEKQLKMNDDSDKINANMYQTLTNAHCSNSNNISNTITSTINNNNDEKKQSIHHLNEHNEKINEQKNSNIIKFNNENISKNLPNKNIVLERFDSFVKWKLSENFLIKFSIIV